MSEIDWDKAPEGATHYVNGSISPFEKRDGDDWYYWEEKSSVWIKIYNVFSDERIKKTAMQVIERPSQAWSGEGLPPVGVVCEVRQKTPSGSSFEWEECRIAMMNTGADGLPQVCTIDKRGDFAIYYPATDIVEFRPIRTPEQIAADEREAAIEEMTQIINKNLANTIAASAIYDAGYRKP